MAKPKQLTIYRWLLLLPIPAIWCLASYLGWLEFLENKLVDWRFRARGEISAPIKVVYVDVDAESITDLGNYPWDRGYFAEVSSALLTAGKVKAIGIDFVFSEKGQPELTDAERFQRGTRELASFLWNGPPVVLASGYASSEDRDVNGHRIVRVLPRVSRPVENPQPPEMSEFRIGSVVQNPHNSGLIDTINGGTRWVPLFARVGDLTFFHMSVELARLYWDVPREGLQIYPDRLVFKRGEDVVVTNVPLTLSQDAEVNWFSRWSSPANNPRASFVDVLLHARNLQSSEPKERTAAETFFKEFAGSVVLIGPADPLMQDVAPTPMDAQPVPRVGIHGNLLKTIVSGKYLHRLDVPARCALIFALTAVVSSLALVSGRYSLVCRVGVAAVIVSYVVAAFVLFAKAHWILPLVSPLGAAFTASFAAVAWQLVHEERQKGRIKSMFGAYVSPDLVNRMVESGEDPKLGGAEVEITAYFSDIQNFSTFSERMTAPQVVELMNEYLTACTDIITAQGGTLDKYIGDAVVAMFGAPVNLIDHSYRACLAAVRVQDRLAELRRKWAAEGGKWPEMVPRMRTRIGLNTGPAVVGNMGSSTRFNYTMMGDSVNLASRLESGAKTYGCSVVVSENTRRACELRSTEFLFRFLDKIVVKGRSQPVAIFELIGLNSTLTPSAKECVSVFEEGLGHYQKQDWARATECFKRSATLEPMRRDFPDESTPSDIYLERCAVLEKTPPGAAWDGVWRMQTK